MRLIPIVVIGMVVAVTMALSTSASQANGRGISEDKLERAGWTCGPPAGPPGHCFPPGSDSADETIVVLVFEGGSFAGTELLVHKDIFADQPCPQGEWLDLEEEVGIPYFACHHFTFDG